MIPTTNDIDWDSLQLHFLDQQKVSWPGESFENTAEDSHSLTIADIENDDSYIAVLGDIHGDDTSLMIATEACRQANIKHLFQVGDFGYLFHHNPANREELSRDPADRLMDKTLRNARDDFGLTLHIIDGNHDNHLLYHRGRESREPRKINTKWDNTELPSMPVYHPRGNTVIMDFDGGFDTNGDIFDPVKVQFGFMGGARSINVPPREERLREGWDFWFDEEPADEDVAVLIEAMNATGGGWRGQEIVDNKILLTHEASSDHYLHKGLRIPVYMEALAARTRDRVAEVINETNPALHIHGHWHQLATGYYEGYQGRSKLLCLAEERRRGNLAFVNMRTNQVWVPQGFAETKDYVNFGHPVRVLG